MINLQSHTVRIEKAFGKSHLKERATTPGNKIPQMKGEIKPLENMKSIDHKDFFKNGIVIY